MTQLSAPVWITLLDRGIGSELIEQKLKSWCKTAETNKLTENYKYTVHITVE
jgi:hypothetical protein